MTEPAGAAGASERTPCERCGDFAELVDYDGHRLCADCMSRLSEIERTPPTAGNLLSDTARVLGRVGLPAALIVMCFDLPVVLLEVFVPDLPALVSTLWGATVSIIGSGAVLGLAHRAIRGEAADVGAALSRAGERASGLIGANFLSSIVVLLYSLLLIVPGIVRGLSLALVLPIALHEGTDGNTALRASTDRMMGHRAVAFVAYLLWGSLGVAGLGLYLGLSFLLEPPAMVVLPEALTRALLVGAGVLLPVFMLPVSCTTAVLYAKTLRYRVH